MLENKFEKFEQDLTCMIDQKNCAIHTHNWQGGKHCLTTTTTTRTTGVILTTRACRQAGS